MMIFLERHCLDFNADTVVLSSFEYRKILDFSDRYEQQARVRSVRLNECNQLLR